MVRCSASVSTIIWVKGLDCAEHPFLGIGACILGEQGQCLDLGMGRDEQRLLVGEEGEFLLHIDGQERLLGAGGFVVLPRGVPHAFIVTSPQAKMLCFPEPGRRRDFYVDASEPMTKGDPAGVVDMGRIRAAAVGTGAIEILGPPPFTPSP